MFHYLWLHKPYKKLFNKIDKLVYLKACPYDSSPEVREISDYISDKNGGKGCVRDIIEQTLKQLQQQL